MALNRKRTILVLIDWYLPGYKAGGPVRSCANLVRHLEGSFHFKILTRNTDYTEKTPYQGIAPDQWLSREDASEVYYLSADKLNLWNMAQIIEETDFDVLYINGVYSPWFSILPLWIARRKHIPNVVVAVRGMLADSAVAVKRYKKRPFLLLSRVLRLHRHAMLHVTNEQEGNFVKKYLGEGVQYRVAPNLPAPFRDLNEGITKKEGHCKLFLLARISHEKNQLYAIECLRQLSPDGGKQITLDLYGPIYSREYWEKCLKAIEELPKGVRVAYKGSTHPSEIPDIISRHHFLFLPTRGENFGHAILESLMHGRPVLISDQTPWKNLERSRAGWDIGLDDKQCFVDVLNRMIDMDESAYQLLSKQALSYAKSYCDDEKLVAQSAALFEP